MSHSQAWREVSELPRIPLRKRDGHKGNYGRVLVLAGSRGMAGAAVLAGMTALRSGAGLVTVACPIEVQPTVAAGFPCYTTLGLPCDAEGRICESSIAPLLSVIENYDCLACGPGLGQSEDVRVVLQTLLSRPNLPMVLDADGLNALARISTFEKSASPLVVTPHPGEFSRLTAQPTRTIQAQRTELAVAYARKHAVIVLLKGQKTVVTDGERVYFNTTGNPGMATGGSGDVLTGLITALLGQGLDPFDAACLGSWVHGRAGDLAAESLGEISVTAYDISQFLYCGFREVYGEPGSPEVKWPRT